MPTRKTSAGFIEPMLLVRSDTLPEGPDWAYELKLDGYRALAIKSYGVAHLRSRNNKTFDGKYPAIVQALAKLPDETVIDGDCRRADAERRPSFNALQNASATAQLCYYLFDVLVLAGRNIMGEPLSARRELLRSQVLPRLTDPIREAPHFDASLPDLIPAVREQGLEGIVAKRLDSAYEPGQRSGACRNMRVNRSQEFVIGGDTIGGRHFDALIFGYWEADRLMDRARTRSGFTPAVREQLHQRFRDLETAECPFANLPEGWAMERGPDGREDEKQPVAQGRFCWGGSSLWSGRRISTCRIRGSQGSGKDAVTN